MLSYYVNSKSGGKGSSISIKKRVNTRFVFYSPKRKLHTSMKILHLFSSNGDTVCADYMGWEKDTDSQRVGSFLVFTKYVEPFNLIPIYVYFIELRFVLMYLQSVASKFQRKKH